MTVDLIIVQNKPTQFDVPLYDFIKRERKLRLLVYYTEADGNSIPTDLEIGRVPMWDHLQKCEYSKKYLSDDEKADVGRVASEIVDRKPRLVIIAGYFPFFHAKLALALKKRGIRIGLRSDNTLCHSNFDGFKGSVKRIILPVWLSLYDTWHPVGSLAYQYFKKIAILKKPSYLFPYNVDNQWFEKESYKFREQNHAIRSEMGLSTTDFVILGILKWHNREDPLTLVEAFKRLRGDHSEVKLILVGDGPLRDVIHDRLKKCTDSTVLPGYLSYSQLPKYYAIADVFVHPASGEPWGVSVNEAMACGVPVIASENVGAGKDLIVDNVTGFTFHNQDIEELYEKLLELLLNNQLCNKMKRAAKQVVTDWSYNQTYRGFIEAIRDKKYLI